MPSSGKLRILHVLKWVSSISIENASKSSKPKLYVNGSYLVRFSSTASFVNSRNVRNLAELAKKSPVVKREAQAILLDYLHSTRSLDFRNAKHIIEHSPKYFGNLLKRVKIEDGDVGKALRSFLNYHPVNEFEPFFESIGLEPSEYSLLLSRRSLYLHDDELLLENYYALCNYGFPRNRIGKLFKEDREIFGYDHGVLSKKLKSFEELGLGQSLVVKILLSSPCLLKQSSIVEFVEALAKLEKAGVQNEWLEQHISEGDSYDWKVILELMLLLSKTGLSDEQLGGVIMQHHDLLLVHTGRAVIRLFGFLSKLGFTQGDMNSLFIHLPDISVLKFASNLCQCYEVFVKVNMEWNSILKTVRLYPILLGSCDLKKVKTLVIQLSSGTQRICQRILDDPNVLKDWVHGAKIDSPVPKPNWYDEIRMVRCKFVLNVGFIDNSRKMKRALKAFRGKAFDLQERFDCLVDLGLSRKEATEIVKSRPQILNQSKGLISKKITAFLDLGYSMSDFLTCPNVITYATERVKLRLLVYQWLRDEKVVCPKLSLSTLLKLPDYTYVRKYVNCHPRGPEIWEKLKKEIYS